MMMELTKIKLLHSFKTFKYTSVTCQLLFYYLNNLISRVEADLTVNKNDCSCPCKSILNTRAIDACVYTVYKQQCILYLYMCTYTLESLWQLFSM